MEDKKPKGIHQDEAELYCNKCNKNVSKHNETLVMDDNVYCIFCDNWLCGKYDAFGEILTGGW